MNELYLKMQLLYKWYICNPILLCVFWYEQNINWDVVFCDDLNLGRIKEMEFLIERNTLNTLILLLNFLYV